MRISSRFIVVTLVALVVAVGCTKSKPTEQQRFEKLQKGVKFRAYKGLSKRVLGPVLAAYDKARPKDAPKIDPALVRLLLGFGWFLAKKPELAIAEAQLISSDEANKSPGPAQMRALGHVLLAMALRSEAMPGLAKAQSERGVKLFGAKNAARTLQFLALADLLLAANAIASGDLAAAALHFGGLEAATGLTWPRALIEVMADAKAGKLQRALTKAKKLASDPSLPKSLRDEIGQAIKRVEKKTGPVDSKLFWPRAVTRVLLEELAKNERLKGLFDVVGRMREQL